MKEEDDADDDVKFDIDDLPSVKRFNRSSAASNSIFEPMVSIAVAPKTSKLPKPSKSVKFKDTPPLLTMKTPNKRERTREIEDQKKQKR